MICFDSFFTLPSPSTLNLPAFYARRVKLPSLRSPNRKRSATANQVHEDKWVQNRDIREKCFYSLDPLEFVHLVMH